jgi:type IV pilus assembly protein PilA
MLKREKGFTLMELMVVIVIVAILAAVAVPLYVNYVKDAQRTEAKAAIGAVITAEQTYFQLNPNGGTPQYANDTFQALGAGQVLNCDLTDALKNWTIHVEGANANGFTVIAEGIAGGPTEGRSVTLVYTRTGQPQWTER